MGPPPLQIRRLIGLHRVTRRKSQRNAKSDAIGQMHTTADASVGEELRSNPMDKTHKANGHAPVSATQEDIARFENWAASDDASGHLVAETASSAAACANRNAYAEMAPASAQGKRLPTPGAASRPTNSNGKASDKDASDKKKVAPEIPPGSEPLPADGASFVEAVHEKVDLIELEVSLLKSEDEKIRQRELAYLRELKYGKSAAFSTDDESRIILDLPRPNRDLPANE